MTRTSPQQRPHLAGALAIALAASCAPDPAASTPPNVLLVTLDTVRADYLSCYGHEGQLTPNFDRLADEGTRFEMCISSSAVTPVSHASILTGRYPQNHGLRVLSADGGYRLPTDVPVISELLEAKGYATSAVHSSFAVSSWFGLERGFSHFDSFDAEVEIDQHGAKWDESHQRRADDTTDRVLAQLEALQEPWFLWVHYWDPHDPVIVPPDEFLPDDIPRYTQAPYEGRVKRSDLQYGEELRYVDEQFGRVLDVLREQGSYDNTIVCLTSDHGEGLSDGGERHGWEFHRILYQEQIRVPLIMKSTSASQPFSDALVRTVDVFPTLLELCDLPVPGDFDGVTLTGLMRNEQEEPRFAYADQINGYDFNAKMLKNRPQADFVYCAMDRDWKLLYRPNFPDTTELYDLRTDGDELANLATSHPDQVKRLLGVLARQNGWVTSPLTGGTPPTAESLAILEKLGYTAGQSDAAQDTRWAWRCIGSETLHDEPGPCPETGEPMIPVRRPE